MVDSCVDFHGSGRLCCIFSFPRFGVIESAFRVRGPRRSDVPMISTISGQQSLSVRRITKLISSVVQQRRLSDVATWLLSKPAKVVSASSTTYFMIGTLNNTDILWYELMHHGWRMGTPCRHLDPSENAVLLLLLHNCQGIHMVLARMASGRKLYHAPNRVCV